MSRLRLFAAAASVLALAAVPTSASAIDLRAGEPQLGGTGWSDGVLVPGEAFSVTLPFSTPAGGAVWGGGVAGALDMQPNTVPYTETSGRQPDVPPGETTSTNVTTPYEISLENEPTFQCGQNVNFAMNLSEATSGDQLTYNYSIQTGVRGAYKRKFGHDGNEPLPEYQTVNSQLVIPQAEGGRVKGLRINLGSLTHQFGTNSLLIQLIAPSGEKVILFNAVGRDDTVVGANPTKSLTDVVFSDDATTTAEDIIADPSGEFTGAIKPFQALSTLDGEAATGTWILSVTDSKASGQVRSGHRGRAVSGSGRVAMRSVGQLGEWTMDLATAHCNTGAEGQKPSPWFGGQDPLIISPAGGTLDASGSVGHDGTDSANANLTYDWDFNGDGIFEHTGQTVPIDASALTGGATKGPVVVTLKVTEIVGGIPFSKTVTRTVIITEAPTVGQLTFAPEPAEADTPITVTLPGYPDTQDPDGTKQTAADIKDIAWDFDLDGEFEVTGVNYTAVHTWDSPGDKLVRVRVTDQDGATTYSTIIVAIANKRPVASFAILTSPQVAGEPISVDGVGSSDADGTIESYEWALGKGTTGAGSFTDPVKTSQAQLTPADAGPYTIRLQVTDNSGETGELMLPITVVAAPKATLTASTLTPPQNVAVTFTAGAVDPADVAGYMWNINGGGFGALTQQNTMSRSYPNVGGVDAAVKVVAKTGATNVAYLRVNVQAPAAGGGGGGTGGGTVGTGGGTNSPIPNAILNNPTAGTNPLSLALGGFGGAMPPAEGRAADGFTASLSASSKQKTAKTLKSGMKAAVKMNAGGKITVKVMLTAKEAVKIKIKLKAKSKAPIAIGSGTLSLKKAGSGKFVIKIKKKYAPYVKRGKQVPVILRAVVTSADNSRVAIARRTVLNK